MYCRSHFLFHPFTITTTARVAAAAISQIPHDSINNHPAAIRAAITASHIPVDFFMFLA